MPPKKELFFKLIPWRLPPHAPTNMTELLKIVKLLTDEDYELELNYYIHENEGESLVIYVWREIKYAT